MIISTQALSTVFFIGATGYVLKLKSSELQMLARVNISVLTPALLFSKISKSLDQQMLCELWFVPILYVILGSVGLEWTRIGGRILGLSDGFRRLCSVAVYFSNVNTIMIPIVEGIAFSPESRFLLHDKNDTPQKMADRAIAYGMIIGIMNNLLRWSVGVAIMTPSKQQHNSEYIDYRASSSHTSDPSSASLATLGQHDTISSFTNTNNERISDEESLLLSTDNTEPAVDRDFSPAGTANINCTKKGIFARIWRSVQPCLTPPLFAVVIALVVVLVPPVQRALLLEGTYTNCLWRAIDACGKACIPATLLALGSQLAIKRDAGQSIDANIGANTNSRVTSVSAEEQGRGIALVVLGRFLVGPACCCSLLLVIHSFAPWLVPLLRTDPMLFLTLSIVSATPPAINLLTVAQKIKTYEGEAARILSYSYVFGMLVLSLEVAIFLHLTFLIHSGD
ncbi:hypothetical protein GGI26_001169 [Coemansia sp. RSA 1358]|nr:hypothetical protein GGI26_001169 [Coemansia sp. RSA 1358]